jgi:hypothetical protein
LAKIVNDIVQFAQGPGKPLDARHGQRIILIKELKRSRQRFTAFGTGCSRLFG